jgi:MFS transporter, FHS family, glucose/mannose:H+ symporter
LLGIFFGIGALFVPLLAATIEGHFTIAQLFVLCAALASACAVAYGAISFPPARVGQALSWREAFSVAKYKGVLLLGFILFFESGNEASVGGWTSTYVNGAGYSPRAATLALAAYWGALMLGRILAARMLHTFAKSSLVAWSAIISLIGCAILLTAHLFWSFMLGTALIGLSYAPIFPTTLAIAGDHYSERAGTVFGLLFSIALIGGMLLPWAVGQVSQQFGLRLGMLVPGLGAVGITVLAIVFMLRERLAGQSPEPARR